MNQEYLKQLLLLSENLLNQNFDGTKNAATALSGMELNEEEQLTVKDIIRSNYSNFSYEQLEEVINALSFDNVEILLAEIELEKANTENKVPTAEEVRKLKGYILITSGSVEDETDRYNLLHPLVLLTIGTRDRELIQEMLEIMEG